MNKTISFTSLHKKILITSAVLSLLLTPLFCTAVTAQTLKWALRPISAQIESYGQLLKIRKAGKCGLILPDGSEVVSAAYDSITPFNDGFALALNRKENRMKIEAVISDGDYYVQPVIADVYAARYTSFNEGKMPVQGDDGWGYLGTDGNIAIPMQFTEAYPFSNGWASVMMEEKGKKQKKQIYYIDSNMNILEIAEGSGLLAFASTFSEGKAVIYTYYGMKGYEIDCHGHTLGRYKIDAKEVRINHDHSVGDRREYYNEQISRQEADEGYQVFQQDGRYGYKYKGQVILPAQLEKAEPVRGGYARVNFNGQTGILRTIDGTVTAQMESTHIETGNGKDGRGFLKLSLPQEMAEAGIQVALTDSNGEIFLLQANNTQGQQRTYSFVPAKKPTSSKDVECRLLIHCENLLLLSQDFTLHYEVAKKVRKPEKVRETPQPKATPALFKVNIPIVAKRANPKDVVYVSVPVKNDGDERGSATVTLFDNNRKVGTGTVSVRGHGMAFARIGIPRVTKQRLTRLKAVLPSGQSAEREDVMLTPFY